MDATQQARLERLVGPSAWAYYGTLPPLDTDGLLSDHGGNVALVAADVLAYACAEQRRVENERLQAAGAGLKSYTAPSGLSVSFDTGNAANAALSQADDWCKQASRLRWEATRTTSRRRLGTVTVEVIPGG